MTALLAYLQKSTHIKRQVVVISDHIRNQLHCAGSGPLLLQTSCWACDRDPSQFGILQQSGYLRGQALRD